MNCELCIDDRTKDFISKHLKDDVNRLALAKFPDDIDREFVVRQIHARQVLNKKLPSWAENDELIFPKKLSLEQSSSELTALYKKSLLSDVDEMARIAICENQCQSVVMTKTLIDLTGGMGVDTAFLSDNFDHAFYVEMQEELCEIARHNFKVLNKNITVVNDNAEHFLQNCDMVDCIYLDPARRDEYGRKMVSLHDCSPDVVELHDLLMKKAKRILIKVSPMLDIEMIKKELKDISEIHVVAVRNECKEVLIEIQNLINSESQKIETQSLCDSEPSIKIFATDLRENWNISFTDDEEQNAQWLLADNVRRYIYEPGVACMKAGCFKLLSQRYALDKLHRNSHLYTSDELVSDFPGRIFEVIDVMPFDKKAKKGISLRCQQPKANVAVRNFPLSTEELKKNLGLHDGGEFYIFGTTMKGENKVIVLTKKL
ncbi:MAG: RsmD family RNA methyltransferase [Bacteroidales bacterium]|nr:RsmD family RNA methyltransferase [Bacteroidales bacterium]